MRALRRKWKEKQAFKVKREAYVIESPPHHKKYDKMVALLSQAELNAAKIRYPELLIRLATEEEAEGARNGA